MLESLWIHKNLLYLKNLAGAEIRASFRSYESNWTHTHILGDYFKSEKASITTIWHSVVEAKDEKQDLCAAV